MVDAPRRYHHGDLRAALIDAAAEQVEQVGIEHLSLRAVATNVGVSPSAAYHHFADKDALLTAVAIRGHERLDAAMQAAIREVPGSGAPAARNRFRAAADAYLRFALDSPHLFRAAFSGHAELNPTEPDASAEAAYARASALLDQLVETGAAPDTFRQGAEEILWATLHGMAVLILEGYLDRTRIPDYLTDLERLTRIAP